MMIVLTRTASGVAGDRDKLTRFNKLLEKTDTTRAADALAAAGA
jgi:hypothetical protein